MDRFTISQLQQFSGIKAHTIRIWEQRYNALTPGRSAGNTRYYDNSQLRRLLNIVSLSDQFRVSELSALPDDKLFELLQKQLNDKKEPASFEYYISQLLSAGIDYDEGLWEKTFNSMLDKMSMREVYINIIYPMLERIGLMWAADTIPPAQEHFISNLLRNKMLSAVDALTLPHSKKTYWLLFLPEDEYHELGLMYAYYSLKSNNNNVIYLGSNVPVSTLIMAAKDTSPDNLLLFLVHNDIPDFVQNYLKNLSEQFRNKKIFVSGNEKLLSQLNLPRNCMWLRSVEELEKVSANKK